MVHMVSMSKIITTKFILENAYGVQNKWFQDKPRKPVGERLTDEDELREELAKEREYLEREPLEEKEKKYDDFEAGITEEIIVPIRNSKKVLLSRSYVYTDFWLVIKMNSLDIDPLDKLSILSSKLVLEIGDSSIVKSTIALNILLGYLMGRPYQATGDTIRIPVVLTLDQLGGYIDPLWASFNDHCIVLKEFLVHHSAYLECQRHIPVRDEKKNYNVGRELVLTQYQSQCCSIQEDNTIDVLFNHITKFFLIQFHPISTDINICGGYDPYLYSVELIANGAIPMEFDSDQILKVEFMGMVMYAISLCPEMRDWIHCSEYLINRDHANSGVNLSMIDTLKIRFHTEQPIVGTRTEVTAISINIQRFLSGMTGVAYN